MGLPCNRTLDKPVLILGLEIEDVAIISSVVGLGSLIINPFIPIVIGAVCWCVFIYYKKDKPSGYLMHLIYSHGVSLPGLLPPKNSIKRYSIR